MKCAGVFFLLILTNTMVVAVWGLGSLVGLFVCFSKLSICFFHVNRIHVSESCDLQNVTSLVKRYIPNVIFSGHRQYELRYKLPLENVNKFPGKV